jgi:hypothetical protein
MPNIKSDSGSTWMIFETDGPNNLADAAALLQRQHSNGREILRKVTLPFQ